MSNHTKQEEMIQLLMQNELYISKLYEVYADRFPDKKEFWIKISEEEKNHAIALKALGGHIHNGKVLFNQTRFNPQTIKFSMEYRKRLILESQASNFTYLQAVSNAYAQEQALLECKFFEVFESDDIELKRVLNYLMESTKQHVQMTRRAWQEAQRKEIGGE